MPEMLYSDSSCSATDIALLTSRRLHAAFHPAPAPVRPRADENLTVQACTFSSWKAGRRQRGSCSSNGRSWAVWKWNKNISLSSTDSSKGTSSSYLCYSVTESSSSTGECCGPRTISAHCAQTAPLAPTVRAITIHYSLLVTLNLLTFNFVYVVKI